MAVKNQTILSGEGEWSSEDGSEGTLDVVRLIKTKNQITLVVKVDDDRVWSTDDGHPLIKIDKAFTGQLVNESHTLVNGIAQSNIASTAKVSLTLKQNLDRDFLLKGEWIEKPYECQVEATLHKKTKAVEPTPKAAKSIIKPTKPRKLGTAQTTVLRYLRRRGCWYKGCNWIWGAPSTKWCRHSRRRGAGPSCPICAATGRRASFRPRRRVPASRARSAAICLNS
jgi:hypothetical protein